MYATFLLVSLLAAASTFPITHTAEQECLRDFQEKFTKLVHMSEDKVHDPVAIMSKVLQQIDIKKCVNVTFQLVLTDPSSHTPNSHNPNKDTTEFVNHEEARRKQTDREPVKLKNANSHEFNEENIYSEEDDAYTLKTKNEGGDLNDQQTQKDVKSNNVKKEKDDFEETKEGNDNDGSEIQYMAIDELQNKDMYHDKAKEEHINVDKVEKQNVNHDEIKKKNVKEQLTKTTFEEVKKDESQNEPKIRYISFYETNNLHEDEVTEKQIDADKGDEPHYAIFKSKEVVYSDDVIKPKVNFNKTNKGHLNRIDEYHNEPKIPVINSNVLRNKELDSNHDEPSEKYVNSDKENKQTVNHNSTNKKEVFSDVNKKDVNINKSKQQNVYLNEVKYEDLYHDETREELVNSDEEMKQTVNHSAIKNKEVYLDDVQNKNVNYDETNQEKTNKKDVNRSKSKRRNFNANEGKKKDSLEKHFDSDEIKKQQVHNGDTIEKEVNSYDAKTLNVNHDETRNGHSYSDEVSEEDFNAYKINTEQDDYDILINQEKNNPDEPRHKNGSIDEQTINVDEEKKEKTNFEKVNENKVNRDKTNAEKVTLNELEKKDVESGELKQKHDNLEEKKKNIIDSTKKNENIDKAKEKRITSEQEDKNGVKEFILKFLQPMREMILGLLKIFRNLFKLTR